MFGNLLKDLLEAQYGDLEEGMIHLSLVTEWDKEEVENVLNNNLVPTKKVCQLIEDILPDMDREETNLFYATRQLTERQIKGMAINRRLVKSENNVAADPGFDYDYKPSRKNLPEDLNYVLTHRLSNDEGWVREFSKLYGHDYDDIKYMFRHLSNEDVNHLYRTGLLTTDEAREIIFYEDLNRVTGKF
jgi:hypothetical protein